MSAPTPDPAYLAQARNFWTGFTKASFGAAILGAALLVLMAIILV